MENNENRQTTFENVWGKKEAANIVSGTIASPFCIQFMAVSEQATDNAHSLNALVKALYERQMYEELLLLLKMLYDLIGMEFPEELAQASREPQAYSELLEQIVLDYDEILTEEIA